MRLTMGQTGQPLDMIDLKWTKSIFRALQQKPSAIKLSIKVLIASFYKILHHVRFIDSN